MFSKAHTFLVFSSFGFQSNIESSSYNHQKPSQPLAMQFHCAANQGEIELRTTLWFREIHGRWMHLIDGDSIFHRENGFRTVRCQDRLGYLVEQYDNSLTTFHGPQKFVSDYKELATVETKSGPYLERSIHLHSLQSRQTSAEHSLSRNRARAPSPHHRILPAQYFGFRYCATLPKSSKGYLLGPYRRRCFQRSRQLNLRAHQWRIA